METENLTAARGRIERQLRPLMPDYDERQDVVQECLVKVWKRHCTYRGDSELTTWLHAVVRNEFLTWVRRARRRYVVEEQAARRGHERSPTDPAQSVLDRVLVERILRELSPTNRTILRMRYLGGHTSAEIGREIGLSPVTIRCRCRDVLGAFGEEQEFGRVPPRISRRGRRTDPVDVRL